MHAGILKAAINFMQTGNGKNWEPMSRSLGKFWFVGCWGFMAYQPSGKIWEPTSRKLRKISKRNRGCWVSHIVE